MQTSDILTQLRKARGLSQKALAEELGISPQAYQKYEYGTAELSYSGLRKIADFYGVTTDYLLGRDTGEPTALERLGSEFNMSALEKKILDGYLNLPPDMRDNLMEFLHRSVCEVMEESEGGEDYVIESHTLGEIEDRLAAEEKQGNGAAKSS